jgi:hypothetical protein
VESRAARLACADSPDVETGRKRRTLDRVCAYPGCVPDALMRLRGRPSIAPHGIFSAKRRGSVGMRRDRRDAGYAAQPGIAGLVTRRWSGATAGRPMFTTDQPPVLTPDQNRPGEIRQAIEALGPTIQQIPASRRHRLQADRDLPALETLRRGRQAVVLVRNRPRRRPSAVLRRDSPARSPSGTANWAMASASMSGGGCE